MLPFVKEDFGMVKIVNVNPQKGDKELEKFINFVYLDYAGSKNIDVWIMSAWELEKILMIEFPEAIMYRKPGYITTGLYIPEARTKTITKILIGRSRSLRLTKDTVVHEIIHDSIIGHGLSFKIAECFINLFYKLTFKFFG